MVMGELTQETELLVIGNGPGGYAAAFRAADLGMDVAMVDTARRPGGVDRLDAGGCLGVHPRRSRGVGSIRRDPASRRSVPEQFP